MHTDDPRPGGIYSTAVAPRMVNWICATRMVQEQRKKVLPEAEGVVVEIGVGSGLNFPLYDKRRIEKLIGIEPDRLLRGLAEKRAAVIGSQVEILEGLGEALPVPANEADTAVLTFTLCTVADPLAVLGEVRRVLRPGGKLLLCEHGKAETPGAAWLQDRLAPVWSKLAMGCQLNRDPKQLLEEAGFGTSEIEVSVPNLMGTHYVGVAEMA